MRQLLGLLEVLGERVWVHADVRLEGAVRRVEAGVLQVRVQLFGEMWGGLDGLLVLVQLLLVVRTMAWAVRTWGESG